MNVMPGPVAKSAVLSQCNTYRYELRRTWESGATKVLWVMLNPSTADATVDDPTVRRCMGFARSWGHGGIVVANLYALRSVDPAALMAHSDPVGPENNDTLVRLANAPDVGLVMAAWGAHPSAIHRARHVRGLLGDVYHLGLTRYEHPRHPLYVKGDTQPIWWPS